MSVKEHPYHLVNPSPWPLVGAFSALATFVGLVFFMHSDRTLAHALYFIIPLGFILFTMYSWWKDTIYEGHIEGEHTAPVRQGMRIGMALFIASEVMFFVAFFWAFFNASLLPVFDFEGMHLFSEAGDTLSRISWPPAGIETLDAWDLPLINTLILLLSGTTVTWAHYAILKGKQQEAVKALIITVVLGFLFTLLQAYEYGHATFGFKEGIYPSVFYMATGFHGAHVIIGTIFLLVCLLRIRKGQMLPPEGHLGFEFAAWYWHFVDVVWLILFACVYVFGS